VSFGGQATASSGGRARVLVRDVDPAESATRTTCSFPSDLQDMDNLGQIWRCDTGAGTERVPALRFTRSSSCVHHPCEPKHRITRSPSPPNDPAIRPEGLRPRTEQDGMSSPTEALERLGVRAIHYPYDARTYDELRRGDYRPSILGEYQAVLDIPVAPFYAQLDAAWPGSRFILTVRDVVLVAGALPALRRPPARVLPLCAGERAAGRVRPAWVSFGGQATASSGGRARALVRAVDPAESAPRTTCSFPSDLQDMDRRGHYTGDAIQGAGTERVPALRLLDRVVVFVVLASRSIGS
jgi:hypothetical protein